MATQFLIGCVWSCLGCCAKEIHQACANLVGVEVITKFYYLMLDVMVIIPSLLMFYYIDEWSWFVKTFARWMECPEESGGQFNCYGVSSVYRLSFSLLLMYLVMVLFMFCRNKLARIVNEMLFFVKYVMVFGGFVGMLYIPNETFMRYARVSQYIGVVFLILQSIILIDLMYLWSIKLVRKYDQGSKCAAAWLVLFSTASYSSAVAINVYGYLEFAECSLWVNIVTSVLLVVMPLVQMLNFNPQNSLFTTGLVCLYVSYLSVIGQFSSEKCNKVDYEVTCVDIAVSVTLFFVTMCGSIVGTKLSSQTVNKTLHEDLVEDSVEMEQMPQDEQQVKKHKLPLTVTTEQLQPTPTNYDGCLWIKWHIYMSIGSIYIAMMATNWGAPQTDGKLAAMYAPNSFGSWARVSLSWITTVIYLWTLVAPRLLPDRNFTIE